MNESPLFVRTHDILKWLLPQMQKFPRTYRFTLSERIQRQGMDFQDSLVWAGKSTGEERQIWLRKADIVLEQLRFWLRFAHEQKLMTIGQYEHAARMTVEMGRLLGAWMHRS